MAARQLKELADKGRDWGRALAFKLRARPLSTREKFLAAFFLLTLASFLYYRAVLEGQIKSINSLEHEIARQEVKIAELLAQGLDEPAVLEEKTRAYERLNREIYGVVPNIKDTPGLIVDLYRAVTSYGLSADRLSFSQLKAGQNYSTFTITTSVKGDRASVEAFLKYLDGFERPASISRLEITPAKGGVLEAAVELTVFVLHDVSPDPLHYPFTDGEGGWEDPFDMFAVRSPEEEKAAAPDRTGGGAGAKSGEAANSRPSPAIPPLKQEL